jgi:hypothetical protein
MTNNLPDDHHPIEPKTSEEFSRMFDAIVLYQEDKEKYDMTGTLWCLEKDKPISGIKSGLAWLGEAPFKFKDIPSLRKAAKDFRFYFDQTPRICLCIGTRAPATKKRDGDFRKVLFLGAVPWSVLDEL